MLVHCANWKKKLLREELEIAIIYILAVLAKVCSLDSRRPYSERESALNAAAMRCVPSSLFCIIFISFAFKSLRAKYHTETISYSSYPEVALLCTAESPGVSVEKQISIGNRFGYWG